jgi:outer membrane receptor for ferrienterochelin and colicin
MTQATIITRSVRILCAGGLVLGIQAAYGQETAEPMQKVLITGSRIASPAAESPSPLQILSSADIAASGASNLQDLLQKNPTMGTPTVSRTNSNFLTSSGGVSTINLRNLGDSRTLVLVNGRRFVSGMPGESAVDLNTISTDFIERVELLTGGASATYGSDAVAGVVNIILKKNFNGMLVDAQTGKSNEGDDFKKKLALTFGTTSADGASNVMGHFGYSKQGAVYSRDRDFSAVDQTSAITQGHPELAFVAKKPNYSGYAPQGHFFGDSEDFTYDANNNIIPWNQNGTADTGAGATGFNRSAYRLIAVPTERYLFATTGNWAFNESHSAFFEGNYASTKADTNIEPFALGSDQVYKPSGQVPAASLINGVVVKNPLVPQYLYDRISDTDGDGVPDYFFTRRLMEFGPRRATAVGNLSSGSIKYSDVAVANTGGFGTEGVDLTGSWSDKVGPGNLSARLAWTWLRDLWQKATPEAEKNFDVGEITANNTNAPRNRANLNLAYKWDNFGATWVATYTGPVSLDDQFLKSLSIAPGTVGVGSRTYIDVQFTYDVRKSMQLYLGLDNAFNAKAPPIITGLPGTETGTSTYDAIGRRYYLGLRVTL